MSLLSHSRRQRTLQPDRAPAQSDASLTAEYSQPSRWSSLLRRRERSSDARDSTLSSRRPERRRESRPHSMYSFREILHRAKDSPDPSSGQLIRQDYSAYRTQTPPQRGQGSGSVQSRVWNYTGPPPELRHWGENLPVQMTSNDITTAQAQLNHARGSTPTHRLSGSKEFQRKPVPGGRPLSTYSLFGPTHDPYSESVADRNIGSQGQEIGEAYRASLDTHRGRQHLREGRDENRRHSLSHKPDIPDLRQLSASGSREDMGFFRRSHDKERKLKSSHGEKPLPAVPNGVNGGNGSNGAVSHTRNTSELSSAPQHRNEIVNEKVKAPRPHDSGIHDSEVHSELGRERGYLVRDSEHPVDLTGIVDLTKTVDHDVTITHAPAVTHETIQVTSREVVQEVITREIHNHHVYHRVLPVLDFEILPARHFIPVEGEGMREIPEDQIPGGPRSKDIQQAIANAIARVMPQAQYPPAPRRFTARRFDGTDFDYKEYVGSDGIKRTEQWWVHPPTLETDAAWTGPTVPFHLHSDSPELDGFRDVVLDRTSDPRALHGISQKPATKRFPPPRGASLGKTTAPLNSGSKAEPMVLPIRMAHGEPEQNSKGAGVGMAY